MMRNAVRGTRHILSGFRDGDGGHGMGCASECLFFVSCPTSL